MNPNYCPICDCYPCNCSWKGFYQATNYYNYKCPDCHGEFNSPSIDCISTTGNPNYYCPFCGKEMKGLK